MSSFDLLACFVGAACNDVDDVEDFTTEDDDNEVEVDILFIFKSKNRAKKKNFQFIFCLESTLQFRLKRLEFCRKSQIISFCLKIVQAASQQFVCHHEQFSTLANWRRNTTMKRCCLIIIQNCSIQIVSNQIEIKDLNKIELFLSISNQKKKSIFKTFFYLKKNKILLINQ